MKLHLTKREIDLVLEGLGLLKTMYHLKDPERWKECADLAYTINRQVRIYSDKP